MDIKFSKKKELFMQLFKKLLIETHGACTRSCPECLRNSYPKQMRLQQKRSKVLPSYLVDNILQQAKTIGFNGDVGFHWFNEPLLEPRLPEFIQMSKGYGFRTYIITNGDLLDENSAKNLKGLDYIIISHYDDPRERNARQIVYKELLCGIVDDVRSAYGYVITHFSPRPKALAECIGGNRGRPCTDLKERMIITCSGEMALCCEDIMLGFKLGSIYKRTLEQLWFSKRHKSIVTKLSRVGGRLKFEYCKICPRA